MGDKYRYRKDTNKLRHSQVVDVLLVCVFFSEGEGDLPMSE